MHSTKMENFKRKAECSSQSDSSCKVVSVFENLANTMNESDSDSDEVNSKKKYASKKIKKIKRDDTTYTEGQSSDSSVEIVDVKLPYEKDVKEKESKATQDLDTLDMWDRLVARELEKEESYDAE